MTTLWQRAGLLSPQRWRLFVLTLGFSLTVGLLGACSVAPPEGVQPVSGFEVQRYLGNWHEVARLDHSFERGLSHVTATYAQNGDGSIKVINRGYDERKKKWRSAEGKAYFVGDSGTGSLKVSFFGPVYGGYHIIALDRAAYRWAMVAGPSRNYLWILAREPQLDPDVRQQLVQQAAAAGFAVQNLIWVSHVPPVPASTPLP